MTGSREALLSKAMDYYAENGVRDTSLRTLAAAIGTSQRMLHYHFGSREDLLAAVIEAVVDADNAMVRELFAKHQDPFEAGRENWRTVAAHARIFGALFFELSSHAMYRLSHADPLREALVTRSEAAFAEAYRRLTDEDSARRLARLTIAVGRGLLFQSLIDDDYAASDAAIESFISMLRREVEA